MARGVYTHIDTIWECTDMRLTYKVDICGVRPGVSLVNGQQNVWEDLLVPCSVC